MKLSVVIPVHNEEVVVGQTLEEVRAALGDIGASFELLVVDDGSADGSWPLLAGLAARPEWAGRLRALRFSRNFGKEAAILAGLRTAGGDAVIVMDADLQHPPVLLPRMVELWAKGGYPVVEAVKRRRQRESSIRRLGARLFYRVLLIGGDLDMRNSTDYKLLDRQVVTQYLQMPERRRFFRGLTSWMGFPTARLEIDPPDRPHGETSWGLASLLELARNTIVSFTSLPLRLVSWIGLAGLGFSLLLVAQTLWNKWSGGSEEGFPTVIILILGMGSTILLSLGLIGEYVSEIYNEVKRRPDYVIRETLPGADGGATSHREPQGSPASVPE